MVFYFLLLLFLSTPSVFATELFMSKVDFSNIPEHTMFVAYEYRAGSMQDSPVVFFSDHPHLFSMSGHRVQVERFTTGIRGEDNRWVEGMIVQIREQDPEN